MLWKKKPTIDSVGVLGGMSICGSETAIGVVDTVRAAEVVVVGVIEKGKV